MAGSLLPTAWGRSTGLWNPEREKEGDRREEGRVGGKKARRHYECLDGG